VSYNELLLRSLPRRLQSPKFVHTLGLAALFLVGRGCDGGSTSPGSASGGSGGGLTAAGTSSVTAGSTQSGATSGGGGATSGSSAGASSGITAGASGLGGEAGGSTTESFVHPGCLSTRADLERMKTKVAAAAEPWAGSFAKLTKNSHAQLEYTPRPQATICAGTCDSENYMTLANDAAAAYQLALRYHVTGDEKYAAKAASVLDAWAGQLTEFTGDSNAGLRAALYGYQLASAGELLHDYTAWDRAPLVRLLTDVFYPIHDGFLEKHNGACESNYWANWDLANMASVLAIGVFADRRDIFQRGIDYFHSGGGEGSIEHAVHFIHPDGLGQWQEAGRDQGHSTLGPMLMAVVCEIAWNQGIDLYGAVGSRLLAGSEYVAAYNLAQEVPFVAYTFQSGSEGSCKQGVQTAISTSDRGGFRAGWELLFNHYVNRRGFAAPFTERFAAALRPEGGGGDYGGNSGGFDSLGFSTLTHTLDPIGRGAPPSNVRAVPLGLQISLSWVGSAYATEYEVKRATNPGGPFSVLATVAASRPSYVDVGLSPGVTYHYVVSAITPKGDGETSEEVVAMANEQLFGSALGTAGSHGSIGATKELALDGSVRNFFDGPESVSWVGIDLGEGVTAVPTGVELAPRPHFAGRMVGGKIQGSNSADFSSGVTDLFTVPAALPELALTPQALGSDRSFRYLRYLSPDGGYGNLAEVKFFGHLNGAKAPIAPTLQASAAGSTQVELKWTSVDLAERYHVKRASRASTRFTIVFAGSALSYVDSGLEPGSYRYIVTALNQMGESAPSAEAPVALPQ